jgi:hypothetical protein
MDSLPASAKLQPTAGGGESAAKKRSLDDE